MNDLSVGRSVCRFVGLSSALWKNGVSDPDAVWHHRSDGFRDGQVVGFGDRSTGRDILGANLGGAIVTDGDFTAYVCDSAATRPSSQITWADLSQSVQCSIWQNWQIWIRGSHPATTKL